MYCIECTHCSDDVCRIYNLPVDSYTEAEYCPHRFSIFEAKRKAQKLADDAHFKPYRKKL